MCEFQEFNEKPCSINKMLIDDISPIRISDLNPVNFDMMSRARAGSKSYVHGRGSMVSDSEEFLKRMVKSQVGPTIDV